MPRGLKNKSGEKEKDRKISIRNGFATGDSIAADYAGNEIKTSKYTCATFVPKNLWEQLHKFGNSYFLCISVIMYLGEKTTLFVGTIKAFSTLGVLLMMMAITAVMALLDDLRRKEADAEINGSQATVLEKSSSASGPRCSTKNWEDVQVGDMLAVRQDEEFPADMVPFYCSGDGGNCYVSTANLDGETNLKLKTAPGATQKLVAAPEGGEKEIFANLTNIQTAEVNAEAPSSNIHDFNGNLSAKSEQESLGAKQLLLRGTVLRNTALCVGLVVYCGADTRMVRNSRSAPMKQSNLEKVTNTAMLLILAAQACMAALSSICHELSKDSYKSYWYIYHVDLILPDLLAYWLTFFTLYSNLMPISLYPTAEFCNAMQSYFIKNDKQMYYKEERFSAVARSSNLCQELGQVSYIFSDKTGTLTQNVMELKRLSISGQTYGELTAEAGFSGKTSILAARRGSAAKGVDAFLEALSVAHTVMASHGDDGQLKYEAESPDEFALVKATADLGWVFKSRKGNSMTVEVEGPDGSRSTRQYTILATNEFNSTRKRMSVVVQRDSEYLLFVKGADNVMLQRAQGKHAELEQDLTTFSRQGLRTLVIGCRRLQASEVNAWLAHYNQASRETRERDQRLEEAAEEIERPLEILGATAIEDKLQDHVPQTIVKFRAAGIKLWVLTGDKLETARNIGFSTKVLTEDMNIQTVDEEDGVSVKTATSSLMQEDELENRAIMVTGKALSGIMSKESSKADFLELAEQCSVLIACRVSPMQKAELVRLVREGVKPTPITLAVGDGANDVPMIQEAQVGVGIAGKEGRQSVNNSDFAIGQFKFLQRLLLVHGRWNYRRACKFTLFTFWRNMVQVLMIFYYTFVSGYSGTVLFEDWIRLSFNVICSLPILAVGCFDQDVSAKTALDHPELYEIGRLGMDLSRKKTGYTLLAAVVHSVIVFLITILAFPSMDLLGAGDYYTFGTTAYSCLIVDMTYRAVFLTNTHNRYTILAVVLSIFGYICWLVFYPSQQWVANLLEPNMYMVPYHMVKTWPFWFCLISVPVLAMVVDVFIDFAYHHFLPDVRDQVWLRMRRSNRTSVTSMSEEESGMLSPDTEQAEESDTQSDPFLGGESALSDSDFRDVDLSDLGQQTLPSIRGTSTWRMVAVIAVMTGTLTLAIGGISLAASSSTVEMKIVYTKGKQESIFKEVQSSVSTTLERLMGFSHAAVFTEECIAGSCDVTVEVPQDMHQPILAYYAIDPFYQNYNDYIKSEIGPELAGREVSQSLREKKCWAKPTRETGGRQIVPCGMKATSLFNDTFSIAGIKLDRTDTAWGSDVARYKKQPDYPSRASTSWLYQRYPTVVTKAEDVKAEAFVTWMRPSAISCVSNPYGYIFADLTKGQKLNVTINSVFNARALGASKTLTLTEIHGLGGRHSAFGFFLVASGLLCYVVALITLCIGLCGGNQE